MSNGDLKTKDSNDEIPKEIMYGIKMNSAVLCGVNLTT